MSACGRCFCLCPKIPPSFKTNLGSYNCIFKRREGLDHQLRTRVRCLRLSPPDNSPLVKAGCCTLPQKCIKMDTRSTLRCSGLNKCTSLTTLMINYDHLELLKGNIPSSFQTPVTGLLGLICNFDHDNQKFTPGAWQLRIERTKSVFKYIW